MEDRIAARKRLREEQNHAAAAAVARVMSDEMREEGTT
jgi:hypothetical protein